jgi:hypothetical protein
MPASSYGQASVKARATFGNAFFAGRLSSAAILLGRK